MKFYTEPIEKSPRISKLVDALYEKMPEIEADRAVLLTESYKSTEGEPIITRRAKAFKHILENIPITIRENELIVGAATKAPRGCQVWTYIPGGAVGILGACVAGTGYVGLGIS